MGEPAHIDIFGH